MNVLGLCYDLLHCCMGDREIMLHENGVRSGMRLEGKAIPTKDVRYGVSILWTDAFQLRDAAGAVRTASAQAIEW